MNFGSLIARTGSPATNSRASSPTRNASKKPLDEGALKTDKALRRYASTIERTLATWEIAPEEWADYIAFLSRLLKAVQSGATANTTLPHSDAIASKLAQCLNPGLPSGVHQKALEVYAYIFATFGKDHVASQLHEYLPGLFPLLSFASLSVRPALYEILEDYVVCLQPSQLRPVLKSFILSILPALEDETSEDFDRALTTMTRLEHSFLRASQSVELASFYWQSVFLSIITCPSRRQGALNYLVRRLPRFVRADSQAEEQTFAPSAEAVISPEPGLLIRAFACGLSDKQMLIQRGFLDLLTTHIPLESPLLQKRVEEKDFRLLLSAAMSVLLRRDMSLNRRVWQWLLGPEPKDDDTEQSASSKQLDYISKYGLSRIEKCLLDTLNQDKKHASDQVKPFRIGLSLMDRWEIGGTIIPKIFLPAMQCAWNFSQTASQAELTDLLKSAKLFFDGVESKLIWSKLLTLLDGSAKDFQLLLWVLSTFNVREEEMTTVHAPLLALYSLTRLSTEEHSDLTPEWHSLVTMLINIISSRVVSGDDSLKDQTAIRNVQEAILTYYKDQEDKVPAPFGTTVIVKMLVSQAQSVLVKSMSTCIVRIVSRAVAIYVALQQKFSVFDNTDIQELLVCAEGFLSNTKASDEAFVALNAVSTLVHTFALSTQNGYEDVRAQIIRLEAQMTPVLLGHISPNRCKHNVEAVKLLWRLDSIFESEHLVQASVQSLVTNNDTLARRDSIRTFLNLWNLSTTAPQSAFKSPVPGIMRRTSSTLNADHERAMNRSHILRTPLLSMFDILEDQSDPAFEDVKIWLNSSPNIEAALMVLFEQLRDALDQYRATSKPYDMEQNKRVRRDGSRSLLYILNHFNTIFHHAESSLWTILLNVQLPGARPDQSHQALTALVEQCLMLLPGDKESNHKVHSQALLLLERMLSAPDFIQAAISVPAMGSIVCERLLECIHTHDCQSQAALLNLSMKSLRWQHAFQKPSQRASNHSRKLSIVTSPNPSEEPRSSDVSDDLLVRLLRSGFSTPACRPYLDVWVRFTEEALPFIGATITTVLIPLTEILCTQISQIFDTMLDSYASNARSDIYAPETTIARLIDILELLLKAAHRLLVQDEIKEEQSAVDSASTVLSNMTPNLFKSQGPPSKTANANKRLTTILASKDVAKICIKIWLWTSNNPESTDPDRQGAGTIAYVALRLRNKARHMLEQVFSLEPLESLEVVALQWIDTQGTAQKELVISLLHVLRDLRPKSTVPAILDALCSRTNATLLTPARQSTLTSDLTSAELVLFFSAYLNSLEDDAVEEVWSDCAAFLRDVLSNPLPHRQILPGLIWIVFQLAQKLENTNYGERKRMRRELGDNFQRLLGATFAALPSGSIEITDGPMGNETPFTDGLKELNLVVILREVLERVELILETADRVALCINAVSVSLITPTLRSKTFPQRINADILALVLRVAKKSPGAKVWRKDVTDAFNDARFITSSASQVQQNWFPILSQWILSDKERMTELLGRLYAPSSAGIMFGVGASAARLDADRKTQLNLRRIALLLLATPLDTHVEHLKVIQEKVVELFEASITSSPSTAVKAELFMLIRALSLSFSAVHFAPLWPIVNDNLKSALLSLDQGEETSSSQTNFSLLQACKLLDLLAATAPDDFQLLEWIYLTNTTDAVYHHEEWASSALSDQLGSLQVNNHSQEDDTERDTSSMQPVPSAHDLRVPMLVNGAGYDTEDIKAMAQDTFANNALRPFLSQMSISLYESRYRMETVDLSAFKRVLVDDLQDAATIVAT